jgi:small-conductance mechanosensitive channel
MVWLIVKYLTTAVMIVTISEIAKRSDKLGALIAALPLVTLLTLVWIHVESGSAEKVANHARYTFWYVLPTLPMFLIFPWLQGQLGFWLALLASAALTATALWLMATILKPFGVTLLGGF